MDSLVNTGDFSWAVPDPGQAFLASTAASWSGVDETFWAYTTPLPRPVPGGGGLNSLINAGDTSWSDPDPGQAFLASMAASWSGFDETFWSATPVPGGRKDGGGGRSRIVLPSRGTSPNKNDERLAITALLALYYTYE